MSGTTEAIDHVAGILLRNDIDFQYLSDGKGVQVSSPDAVVVIRGATYLGEAIVSLSSNLVSDVSLTQETQAGLYFWVNQRNMETRFVRYAVVEQAGSDGARVIVVAEWDLPARDLQASELLTAFDAVSDAGRCWSGELMSLFGGENFRAYCERRDEEEAAGLEGD